MPTTPKLPIKLHERLGDEAMTELLSLFGDLGAETRAEFREIRQQIADVKQDLQHQIGDLRQETARVRQELGDLRQELGDLRQQLGDLKPHIAGVQAELIKWTFLFGLGTIGIVLLLIRLPH